MSNDETAKHVVIAHSHGGNIALIACNRDPILKDRVSAIVCAATPFIHCRERSWPKTLATNLFCSVIIGGLLLWIGVITSQDVATLVPYSRLLGIIFSIYSLALAPMLISVLLIARCRHDEVDDWVVLPKATSIPLLVIQPLRDEAMGVLTSLQFGAWAANIPLSLCERLIGRISALAERWLPVVLKVGPYFAGFAIGLGIVGRQTSLKQFITYGCGLLLYGSICALGLMAAVSSVMAVLALGIIIICTVGWGFDCAASCFQYEWSVTSVPSAGWYKVLVADQPHAGLSHSASLTEPEAIRATTKSISDEVSRILSNHLS